MEKVTIVVPFYNVEEYIGECLDSLLKQVHNNIEILCIDDCSPDKSLAVVETYAARDNRIKIISHEENKGLGGARNTGVNHATSDYICFVDSDDYVSDRYVELLLKAINRDNSDVAVCCYWQDLDGELSKYYKTFQNATVKIAADKTNVVEIAMQINPGCTNKIYRRNLIVRNNMLQPERRYYEDTVYWLKAVYYSSAISTVSDRLYYYRQRPGSNMKTFSHKHIDDMFEFMREIDSFVKNEILSLTNIDIYKVANDLLLYLLEYIMYGKTLIAETDETNVVAIENYYEVKIRELSINCNYPALSTACKYYLERLPKQAI